MTLAAPRRLRYHPRVRELVQETKLSAADFIQPVFIKHGRDFKREIPSMPGCYQYSVDRVAEKVQELGEIGIKAVLLFGIPAHKNATGTVACDNDGVVQEAIRAIKKAAPEMLVIVDLCLCEYTDHGHCGLVHHTTQGFVVDNDDTLPFLVNQAVSLAYAGADVIAPSAMMDGMVGAIRAGLDLQGYTRTPILSYAVKYASSLYGPFRQAAEGAPQFGDRRTYQMDPANTREALKEAKLDILEGADILMVKPAHTYLDVIYRLQDKFPEIPLFAYHTSGEYALLEAAIREGWVTEEVIWEVMIAIKRAGADAIITYYAERMVRTLAS